MSIRGWKVLVLAGLVGVTLAGCATPNGGRPRNGMPGTPPTNFNDFLYTPTRPANARVIFDAGDTRYNRTSGRVKRVYDDPEISPDQRTTGGYWRGEYRE
ncbi:MAG: hypothetical protein AMXMBFR84_12300 [Candidatus Hydrogenedentota bacterium]